MEFNFDEYQDLAFKTANYPNQGNNLIYPALGLAGEAGEVADKIKKYWRNHGITSAEQMNAEQKNALLLEMGDSLWYLGALCVEIGVPLSAVAQMNINKLLDRKERGVIKSEGDNR